MKKLVSLLPICILISISFACSKPKPASLGQLNKVVVTWFKSMAEEDPACKTNKAQHLEAALKKVGMDREAYDLGRKKHFSHLMRWMKIGRKKYCTPEEKKESP